MNFISLHIRSDIQTTIKMLQKDRRVAAGLIWNLFATIAGRSSGILLSIIVSRALGKDIFGEFSIIQSTVLTLGVLAGFGSGLTATKHIAETFRTDRMRSGRILALSTVSAIIFGALLTVTLLMCSQLIAGSMLAAPKLAPLLQVASFSLFAGSLSGAQSGALAGFEAFRMLSKVNVYSGIAGLLSVSAGIIFGGLSGALWGYNIAAVISCLIGAAALSEVMKDMKITPDYKGCLRELPLIWKFSIPTMLANILVTFSVWVCNAMLVRRSDGFVQMAIYNAATQWRQLLLFLPGIIAQVFLPVMASETSNGGQHSIRLLYKNINIIVTLPFLILFLIMSPVLMSLYGRGFSSYWPVFVVVQLATFLQILQASVMTSWIADGRMWTNFAANVFWGGSLVLFSRVWIDLGAQGLALGLLTSFLLYFLVIRGVQWKVRI